MANYRKTTLIKFYSLKYNNFSKVVFSWGNFDLVILGLKLAAILNDGPGYSVCWHAKH